MVIERLIFTPPMSYDDKAHCLIAYAFFLILIRVNNTQCFVARLLCFKMIRNIPQGAWFLCTALLHISYALKRLGTNSKLYGSMDTALFHISCVLKWSGTKNIMHTL